MNPHELFQVWAPEGAPWSPWVKPVLFAAEGAVPDSSLEAWQAARARSSGGATVREPLGTALVLDLPGPYALALALDSARSGWQPVPLFNSCTGISALIDNHPLRAGLVEGAALLGGLVLPDDAPPAFVLDARRLDGQPASGRFDNRWIVFPQDFPSAALLQSRGVRRAILIQEGRRDPRPDLAHVLLRWQRAGLELLALDLAGATEATPIAVSTPGLFRAFGYRILSAVGLRRSGTGGFGARVPVPGHGGGVGGFA